MKKALLLILAVLMATLAVQADVTINSTNFPDANFRSYLLSEYPSGTITTAQLNARTTLPLSSKGITNAKGIEYFTELTRLDLYSNALTTVDVSALTKLIYLNLGINQLTSINVNNNTVLEQLYLQGNKLSSVNVCNHSKLRTLWVNGNTSLTGLYCWRNALTNVDVTGCTALKQLKIYNNDNLTSIYGLADCTALTWLDVEDTSFSDLSAVQGMTSLETLLAGNTRITTLETSGSGSLTKLHVAGDKQLTELNCMNESLTELRVTGCTALQKLRCYYNYDLPAITGLADCTALTYLDCEDCSITALPGVNNMSNLQTLWARNNQLTGTLTVSSKPYLKSLRVKGNTGLTKVNCDNCALTSLDVTGCTGLELLDCQNNPMLSSVIGLTDCTALTWFACDYCDMTSLDMTFCPGLNSLYCYNNQLTSLNVTGLTSLEYLNCKDNPDLGEITGLGDCAAVIYLECSNCGLTSLDVNHMSGLQELWSRNNNFTMLAVNNKSQLTTLVVDGNASLKELECYNGNLTQLSVYNCPELYYLDCEVNQIANLNLSTCPKLKYLLVNGNQLTSLDISNNPHLLYIWCNDNNLTSLDLTNCEDGLESFDCRYNQITGTLDVGRFTDLRELAISSNEFSSLQNVANHTALTTLYCASNHLTSLDASGCTALQTLQTQNNQLTSLNVSDCPALKVLAIFYNQINRFNMEQIVNDINTRPATDRGMFYVWAYDPSAPDLNYITTAQVEQVESKYWNVYAWLNEDAGWSPYAGMLYEIGDVNGDGHVTIADVSALIDLLLAGTTTGNDAADVNGDGHVTIADVSALIDLLLSGSASMMKHAQVERPASTLMPAIPFDKELVLEMPQRRLSH